MTDLRQRSLLLKSMNKLPEIRNLLIKIANEIENNELLKSRCPFLTENIKLYYSHIIHPPPHKYQRRPHHDYRHLYKELENII